MSWATAFNDLRSALIEAFSRNQVNDDPADDVSEIWVAAGVYKPGTSGERDNSFWLQNNVGIYGGFVGVETETKLGHRNPNPITNGTVLSGDLGGENSIHVVISEPMTYHTAVLDGFTITGGNASGGSSNPTFSGSSGGGMYVLASNPTLQNLFFYANVASGSGGGLKIENGSGTTLTACTFSANESLWGGGLSISNNSASTAAVTVRSCEFSDNTAANGGGLSYVAGVGSEGALVVESCLFVRNTASGKGGGVYLDNGSTRVSNTQVRLSVNGGLFAKGSARLVISQSTFWKNRFLSDYGSGLRLDDGAEAWLLHCAFVKNNADIPVPSFSAYGAGLCVFDAACAHVVNSIFWANSSFTGDQMTQIAMTPSAELDMVVACVQYWVPQSDDWVTSADPKFVNQEAGDLRLQSDSSCIDSGYTLLDYDPLEPGFQFLPETDLAGQTRIVDGNGDGLTDVDIGPYEYQ